MAASNPHKPVALVSMPTLSAQFPSFQLALLKPTLERHGFSAQPFSLFMYFGQHIGWRVNEALAKVWGSMVGEWIWSRAAFGEFGDDQAYFREYAADFKVVCDEAGCTLEELVEIRDRATASFLDFCVESVDWSRFGVIGFTVVFQQTLASIALAKRLKERFPAIPLIFGGATFEDDIAEELIKGCPWIDYIHCGDGD